MVSQLKVNEIITQSGTSLQLGKSGDTVTLASGASQSGFSILLQQKYFSNTTRITTSGQSADLELFTYTTSFVKQSNDSELHIWFNVPYEGSVQGAQNGMLQWTHSDGTVTQFFGSRQYVYIPTHSSFQGGVGMLDGMKSGTYTIKQFITSNGNSGNSGGSYNPNGSDDNRYEFSTDTQGASGTAGSKSTLIIQEIA